ncbi:hypothetical protein GobsT_25570 [Gemmata obscuriglobus]|uniref:Uncharacterized protein n=1 Tax=Gemmata obscuriglobus TaxID=114 RepID=A0A2Z3H2S4_9BACT|nr:hypothetical protein [Gemmata obscuriglobus]AWM39161.1 hypothetical protein C1280_20675 [Gemmata obscuriglobus]QEG27793.1 hypothetical protein GobsT_25570 [Gemmata obscuriglobus]VTS05112.1 unnamed protein product [Gemmata obscuriglobus UQM 2246]
MDIDDITTEQARKLYDAYHPVLGHLSRVRQRLDQLGFPLDDAFLKAVSRAQDAMRDLTVELNYMACPAGTGCRRRQ